MGGAVDRNELGISIPAFNFEIVKPVTPLKGLSLDQSPWIVSFLTNTKPGISLLKNHSMSCHLFFFFLSEKSGSRDLFSDHKKQPGALDKVVYNSTSKGSL